MYLENYSRPSLRNFNHPSMANTTLVLPGPHHTHYTTNGLSTLWESFKRYIVSPEITKILMASWQDSTKKQYKVHIEKWLAFCHQRCISYSSLKVNEALDLLMVLYNKGLTYSTINTAGLLFHPSLLSKEGTTLDSTP